MRPLQTIFIRTNSNDKTKYRVVIPITCKSSGCRVEVTTSDAKPVSLVLINDNEFAFERDDFPGHYRFTAYIYGPEKNQVPVYQKEFVVCVTTGEKEAREKLTSWLELTSS